MKDKRLIEKWGIDGIYPIHEIEDINDIEEGDRIDINRNVVWEMKKWNDEKKKWEIIVWTKFRDGLKMPFEAEVSRGELQTMLLL